jgi:hypothetical protein
LEENGNTRYDPVNPSRIVIDKPVTRNGKLTFKLSFSRDLDKYFLSDQLEYQYSIEIDSIAPSILYIPAVSSLICAAWAIGADIFVQDIDETYLSSLADIKKVFTKWFPKFSFSTRIQAEKTTENHSDNCGSTILFTGGLDSLTSLLRNGDKHPTIICIWGASHPFPENNSLKKRKQWEANFLQRNIDNSKMCFVSSNIGNLINDSLLAKNYIREDIKSDDWWETVSHGLTLTGIAAPITIMERTADLLMASSLKMEDDLPNGSHLFSFVTMRWATTKVVYDSNDLSRQDKIRTVLKGNTQYYKYLQVCDNIRSKRHNCGHCEKCLRTILGLILENIDPNECNFTVHNGILEYVKACLLNGWISFGHSQKLCWEDIQDHIKDHKISESYNAIVFFEWFRDFNLSDYQFKGNSIKQLTRRSYYLAKYDFFIALKLAFRLILSTIWSFTKKQLDISTK